MSGYILYSTLGCHLCEEAEALLHAKLAAKWDKVDIADSDELVERYGLRIPVLCCRDTNDELNWPFDCDSLREFLAAQES